MDDGIIRPFGIPCRTSMMAFAKVELANGLDSVLLRVHDKWSTHGALTVVSKDGSERLCHLGVAYLHCHRSYR